MDWFLGLVAMLPEQHEDDLLLQIRWNEAVNYLTIHDLLCGESSSPSLAPTKMLINTYLLHLKTLMFEKFE